jgi:hypothetical protein
MAKSRPCQRCGEAIPAERIEALPETRLCLKCSQNVGGDFQRSFTTESLGKTGSLKKNYGGINVNKSRRKIEPLKEADSSGAK